MKLWGQLVDRDENLLVVLAIAAVVAFAATTLVVYAHVKKDAAMVVETFGTYEQLGRYSYTVETGPSPLNAADTIGPIYPESPESGSEPPTIFTRLAKQIHFLFVYQLSGASDVSGTVSGELKIRAGDSWTQEIVIAEPVQFTGTVGGFEGTIDLAQIAFLLARIEEQTGVSSSSIEMSIVPQVDVQGTASGRQFSDHFSSPLTFIYTEGLITPGESLAYSDPGAITRTSRQDNELQLAAVSLPVATVRSVATPAAIIALIVTVLMAAMYFLGIGRPEAAIFRSRYGSLVVPVTDVASVAGYHIRVESLLDLVRIAKAGKHSILIREFEAGQVHIVCDGMVMYQHVIGAVPQDWIRTFEAPSAPSSSTSEPLRPERATADEPRNTEIVTIPPQKTRFAVASGDQSGGSNHVLTDYARRWVRDLLDLDEKGRDRR